LAASEASARVGRAFSIIDSSTCVATMTGLARRRAISQARFCTSGTSSRGSLDAEVTAGHHDTVEGPDDLIEVLDRLRLLDLGDDGQAHALLVHDLVDVEDVLGAAHERQRDHVHPQRRAQRRSSLSFSDIAGTSRRRRAG
jgi:hypothetical protein